MIKFEKISIKGFGAIIDMVFEFCRKGINIIRGKNGSGKTTVFNALYWCLFGLNLKGITKGKLMSRDNLPEDFKGTQVHTAFQVEGIAYDVVRHIKYKGDFRGVEGKDSLLIYKDEVLMNHQHIDDAQAFIIELLQMDSKVFLSSVLFGQRMKRFIEADAKDKRSLFETIIDMSYIDKAKENCDGHLTHTASSINNLRSTIDTNLATINSNQAHITHSEGLQTQFVIDKNNQLASAYEELSDIKLAIGGLVDLEVPKDAPVDAMAFDEYQALKEVHSGLEAQLRGLDELDNVMPVVSLEEKKDLLQQELDSIIYVNIPADEELDITATSEARILVHKELADLRVEVATFGSAPIEVDEVCNTCGTQLSADKIKILKNEWQEATNDYHRTLKMLNKRLENKKIAASKLQVRLDNNIVLFEQNHKNKEARAKQALLEERELSLTAQIVDKEQEITDFKVKQLEISNKREQDRLHISKAIKENRKAQELLIKIIDEDKKAIEINKANEVLRKDQEMIVFRREQFQASLQRLTKIYKDTQASEYDDTYLKELITKKATLLDENERKRVEAENLDALLEVLEYWSKTGFTSKGLKGYITDASLQLLNKSIFKYSSILGFRIIFSIDTTKKSKPFLTRCFNAKGIEFDYEEFSGGEQARLDVATAFALHDLVSSTVEFNILIMDEVFEGLDDEGIEDVFELIRLKSEDKNVFVIAHSPHLDARNTNLIEISKGINGTVCA